jgi:hypothetical protein
MFRKRKPSLGRQLHDMGQRMRQVAQSHEAVLLDQGRTVLADGYGYASTPKRVNEGESGLEGELESVRGRWWRCW